MKQLFLGRVRAVSCICVLYSQVGLKVIKKVRKHPQQSCRKVPFGHDSVCQHGHLLVSSDYKFVDQGVLWDALGNTGERSDYIDICRAV